MHFTNANISSGFLLRIIALSDLFEYLYFVDINFFI
jgi:hypothetical protein